MDELKFWNSWNSKYKYFLLGASVLLLMAISMFVLAYIVGDSWYYSWGTITQLESIYIPTGSFVDHYQQFSTEAYNYLIIESFSPEIMKIDKFVSLAYVIIIGLSFGMFMGLATTLKRTYFYISLLVSMVFLAFAGLDLLEISDSIVKPVLAISILTFSIPAYVIYSFYTIMSFIQRISIMTLISVVFGISLYFVSPLSNHAISLTLIGYSSLALIPLSLLFVLLVAIEPIAFLLL